MANTSNYENGNDINTYHEHQGYDDKHDSIHSTEEVISDNDKDNKIGTVQNIDPSISKIYVVRNPVPKLNTEKLKSPNGIQTIENYFEGFKYYGKGCEKMDLDRIMKRLEHWSYRLFPKYHFDDFLARIEQLGAKKDLQVYLKKYRLDMITSNNDLIIHDNMNNEEDQENASLDDFDLLIAEQIQKQKQIEIRTTSTSATPDIFNEDAFNELIQFDNTPNLQNTNIIKTELSNEIRKKIETNKQLAIQKRLQRQKERKEKIN